MPKPSLREPYNTLENEMIDTMTAGLHEWRPDLNYPESFSDWQAAVRGLMRMFAIERRPLAMPMREMLSEHDKDCKCANCSK